MPGRLEEVFVVWSAARAEANDAYEAWCASPCRMGYAIYRAAEDRADAAETELANLTAGALILV